MKQINIRISDKEFEIVKMIAKRKGIPITTVFREAIAKSFDDWKLETLFELYSKGLINFKRIVELTEFTFAICIAKFAKSGLEPPFSESAELRAEDIVESVDLKKLVI